MEQEAKYIQLRSLQDKLEPGVDIHSDIILYWLKDWAPWVRYAIDLFLDYEPTSQSDKTAVSAFFLITSLNKKYYSLRLELIGKLWVFLHIAQLRNEWTEYT
jgi:hypothetical protein